MQFQHCVQDNTPSRQKPWAEAQVLQTLGKEARGLLSTFHANPSSSIY